VQNLNLNQEYWVLYVIGEHTPLLTWLEFPDCNIQLKLSLSASCVPVESTWHLLSGPSPKERTVYLSVVVILTNAIILLKGITMH
jgi:hypothetical protein